MLATDPLTPLTKGGTGTEQATSPVRQGVRRLQPRPRSSAAPLRWGPAGTVRRPQRRAARPTSTKAKIWTSTEAPGSPVKMIGGTKAAAAETTLVSYKTP